MPTEKIATESAVGRICGAVNVSCPPAVPVVIAGERISESEKALLDYYGVTEIEVVSE
jgi:arginine/lysine/ornithine decarboxylase